MFFTPLNSHLKYQCAAGSQKDTPRNAGHKYKSSSTGWQAVTSWEANEEVMTYAPATFEIQNWQGADKQNNSATFVQNYTLTVHSVDCDPTCQMSKVRTHKKLTFFFNATNMCRQNKALCKWS